MVHFINLVLSTTMVHFKGLLLLFILIHFGYLLLSFKMVHFSDLLLSLVLVHFIDLLLSSLLVRFAPTPPHLYIRFTFGIWCFFSAWFTYRFGYSEKEWFTHSGDAIGRYDSLINFVAIGHVGSLRSSGTFNAAGSLH